MSRLYRSRWRSFEKTCLRCRRVVSFFKKCGTLQEARTLSHLRHTQNKKCLSDQSHSRFPEESIKEEGEEGKDKDAVPQVQVRKKKDDDKEE